MYPSPSKRKAKAVHQHHITYKAHVWRWVAIHRGANGDSFRVSWTVAGIRKKRVFRSYHLAQAFQSTLTVAVAEGQPFDVRSGMPLCLVAEPRRKRRRRRHHGTLDGSVD